MRRIAYILTAIGIGLTIGGVAMLLDEREDDIAAMESRLDRLRERGM